MVCQRHELGLQLADGYARARDETQNGLVRDRVLSEPCGGCAEDDRIIRHREHRLA
jgi:hypothetical protein